MQAAIVTTLRRPVALESFIRHHLAAGFDHLFLFFDDPKEIIESGPQITAIPHDAWLREAWRNTQAYEKLDYLRNYIHHEVMARQCLNAAVAIRLSLDKRIDWLLHIDADELFYLPEDQPLRDHFQNLINMNVRRVIYPNFEAVPERTEIGDFFKEVTLFKVNRQRLPGAKFNDKQIAAIRSVPQLAERFFNFYTNGKCAARVSADLLPSNPHRFLMPGAPESNTFVSRRQAILHYAICGFEQFWNKYTTRGRFSDKWFGQVDIKSVEPFHLEARDIVAAGNRDAAREFYTKRVVISDDQVINRLIAEGVLARIIEPRMILDTINWGNDHDIRR
ncbi:MAG: glycosyltransferase family 2 protein [Blastocatellia bacterium]|nr:glycosyltransferase family 2 protein [Blastocatellia bacterium]